MGSTKLIAQADAIVDGDLKGASVDLRSFSATYRAKRDAGDSRAQSAWARAVVNRAGKEGVEGKGGKARLTKAELLAEIESRNADRDDDAKIVPASEKNADLEQALAADDAK
jgi:hypothetical protein